MPAYATIPEVAVTEITRDSTGTTPVYTFLFFFFLRLLLYKIFNVCNSCTHLGRLCVACLRVCVHLSRVHEMRGNSTLTL